MPQSQIGRNQVGMPASPDDLSDTTLSGSSALPAASRMRTSAFQSRRRGLSWHLSRGADERSKPAKSSNGMASVTTSKIARRRKKDREQEAELRKIVDSFITCCVFGPGGTLYANRVALDHVGAIVLKRWRQNIRRGFSAGWLCILMTAPENGRRALFR